MLHELQVFCIYLDDNSTNEAIDLVGAFSLLCFPMEISGEKVAGFLQNTSVIVTLINHAMSCMSSASSVSSYGSPMISCSTLARTVHSQ